MPVTTLSKVKILPQKYAEKWTTPPSQSPSTWTRKEGKKKREEKRRKAWIKQKEDAKKPLTAHDSEASDKCESPPIVPGNTDTQMVNDITSDWESTSTTNDSEPSDKCEIPLIVPETQMVGITITESEYQKFEEFMYALNCQVMIHNERLSRSYWQNPMRPQQKYEKLKYVSEN